MVNKFFYMAIIVLKASLFSVTAQGKQMPSSGAREKVILFTDRNMYITGEEISFSASIRPERESTSARVLYSELVTPEGRKVVGGKFMLNNSTASGTLTIPDDILTGNYFIRAYTRYMRNYGPDSFAYILIKIINPRRSEVQSEYRNEAPAPTDTAGIADIKEDYNVKTDMKIYHQGDSIRIYFSGKNLLLSDSMIVSVVPEQSFFEKKFTITSTQSEEEKEFIYPETNGVTLTGKVMDESGMTIKGMMINLSVLGGINEFMAMRTDSAGRFFFAIPDYTGSDDIFICTEKTLDFTPEIRVDNDFYAPPVLISAASFKLSPEERETATTMAINQQIKAYFQTEKEQYKSRQNRTSEAFYGRPDETLYLEKYIQLPTLEEYFNELPMLVRVRKRSGQKYFRIHSSQSELIDFDPLVLIDMVAIDDPEKILAINPASIRRIEIVNSLYLKGDQVYGGIINFISQNSDFAGINLPGSGIFLNYEFFKPHGAGNTWQSDLNIPDTRNTLIWLKICHQSENEPEIIKVPDTPGKYIVVVRGVDKNFSIIQGTATFEVR